MGVRGNGVRVPASVLERARVPFGEPDAESRESRSRRDESAGSLGSAMQRISRSPTDSIGPRSIRKRAFGFFKGDHFRGNRPRRRRRAFWTGESLGAPRFYFFAASGPTCGLEPPFLGEPPRVGSATAPGAPRTTKGLTATAEDDGASRRRRLRGRRGERTLETPLARRASRGTLGAPPARPRGARVVHAPPRARALRAPVCRSWRALSCASSPRRNSGASSTHARFRPVVAGASRAARVRPSTPDAPRTAPATPFPVPAYRPPTSARTGPS